MHVQHEQIQKQDERLCKLEEQENMLLTSSVSQSVTSLKTCCDPGGEGGKIGHHRAGDTLKPPISPRRRKSSASLEKFDQKVSKCQQETIVKAMGDLSSKIDNLADRVKRLTLITGKRSSHLEKQIDDVGTLVRSLSESDLLCHAIEDNDGMLPSFKSVRHTNHISRRRFHMKSANAFLENDSKGEITNHVRLEVEGVKNTIKKQFSRGSDLHEMMLESRQSIIDQIVAHDSRLHQPRRKHASKNGPSFYFDFHVCYLSKWLDSGKSQFSTVWLIQDGDEASTYVKGVVAFKPNKELSVRLDYGQYHRKLGHVTGSGVCLKVKVKLLNMSSGGDDWELRTCEVNCGIPPPVSSDGWTECCFEHIKEISYDVILHAGFTRKDKLVLRYEVDVL